MTAFDRLKEAAEACRNSDVPTRIYLDPEGVVIECHLDLGGSLTGITIEEKHIIAWSQIELAKFNPVTYAMNQIREKVRYEARETNAKL